MYLSAETCGRRGIGEIPHQFVKLKDSYGARFIRSSLQPQFGVNRFRRWSELPTQSIWKTTARHGNASGGSAGTRLSEAALGIPTAWRLLPRVLSVPCTILPSFLYFW
jgi:hypothetical protein